MNRAKQIVASMRLVNSILSTQHSITRCLHSQVTQYSHLSLYFSSSLSKQAYSYDFLNTHQKQFFSSKPNSLVELVLNNDWSEEVEQELQKSHPTQTHETVLYVLKKLDRNPEKALNFFNWVSDKNGFKASSTVYSLMLRVLGRKETMKEFWILVKKMSDEGYDMDEGTYNTLLGNFGKAKMTSDAVALTEFFSKMVKEGATDAIVKSVVEVIQESDWNDEVKKKLEDLKISLSENTLLRILRQLRAYPLKALRFFCWAADHHNYKHNAVTYNAIVRVLGREESVDKFWDMVKEMKSSGHEMDIDTYIKLARQFQRSKMMKDAVELYEFMMDGPYKPPIHDCSTLLRQISLCANPDLSLVFRVVKKYEATGHSLSKAVYDGIHRSLTSVGKFDEADKILETMKNAGYEPDNITYSQVVFGLCKAGRLEEACKTVDDMEKQGCTPDLKTWTILIQGHCMAGDVENALTCFTKMIEKNCEADADLLEVLVNGLCGNKRINSAYNLVVEMVDTAHLRPWQATYKNMIQNLLAEGKLEESLKLLRLMKKHNYPPFQDPFVQYISKFGTVHDAKEFLKALSVKEYPSSTAYLNVFLSFFKEGRHSEAQDLLYKCPHHIRNHNDILSLFGSLKRGTANA
ncbi:Pentatricopeptide repeat [Macleaya cordata]|uniref:Pentatricopeptide repeat n=1 Tax=Macleaya cordata TaxID=56857 RepID=A0A200Q7X1_MACCD|nr:Pentatricopeptide repeat [Macleaya cordata]